MTTTWTNPQTFLVHADFYEDPDTVEIFLEDDHNSDDDWVLQLIKYTVYLNDERRFLIEAGESDRGTDDIWTNEQLMMVDWYQLLNAIR